MTSSNRLVLPPFLARLNKRTVFRVVLVLVAYLAAFGVLDSLTQAFQLLPGVVAWYPPDGLSLALLLTLGARFAPAIAVASLISSFFIYRLPQPTEALLLWAVGLSLTYGVAAAILRRAAHFDWQRRGLRGLVWLVLSSAVVSALLAALSVSGSTLSGDVSRNEYFRALFHWWIGETVGVLTVTPFLLVHVMPWVRQFVQGEPVKRGGRQLFPRLTFSVFGQVSSLVLVLYSVFGTPVLNEFQPLYLITLPLIWIALEHGFKGITAGVVALNFAATFAIWVFRFDIARLGELQLLMLVICMAGLFMGKVVSDQKSIGAELAEKARALEASALEQAHLLEKERRHVEQAAAVNAFGQAMAESLELEVLIVRLKDAILRLMPDLPTVLISLYDPEKELIRWAYVYNDGKELNARDMPAIPLAPPGKGMQSEVIRSRKWMAIGDLQATVQKNSETQYHLGDERLPRSALYLPMLAKNHVLGTIQLQSYELDRFSEREAELFGFLANTAAIAIQNARLFTDAARRLKDVEALRQIDMAITSTMDLKLSLHVVLEQVITRLDIDAASILLLNKYTQRLEFAAGLGFRERSPRYPPVGLGEGSGAGRAALERRRVEIPDLNAELERGSRPNPFAWLSPLLEKDFNAYFATPLVAKGHVIGALEVFHRAALDPAHEWLNFMETLAGQAAIAVDNLTLFSHLQRANADLAIAYDETIEGWSKALDLRDKETEGHTLRVTETTMKLGRLAGISDQDLLHVRQGALLHDIGKMGIPDSILLKPDKLTEAEWDIIRRHPVYAYELLSSIAYLRPALDIPYCHHEKWDGSGYPRGLKGEHIPLAARLFAVVDVWDALRSDRPYRQGWPEERVREHIRLLAGTHFEPRAVELFLQLMPENKEGAD